MEKKAFEKELKLNRWAIVLAGIISCFTLQFSEYGDGAFRWSFAFLIVGITIFMFVVTTFILYSVSNK